MDKPRRVFLVRHGRTEYNEKEIIQGGITWGAGLSSDGKIQALLTGRALKYWYNFSGKTIIASCTQRAEQTAQIIRQELRSLKTLITLKPDLNEPNYGDWENKTYEEIKNLYAKQLTEWWSGPSENFRFPNGEYFGVLDKRILGCFYNTVGMWLSDDLPKDNDLIIIGHAIVNRIILLDICGAPTKNWRKLEQDNCCINIINFYKPGTAWGRKTTLGLLNSTNHLS